MANYIDLARFVAIYAVVLGHFHPFIGTVDNIGRQLIYLFHMPIFFIISGMLSKQTKFSKLCYSLLIPYVIYNIISIVHLDFIPFLTFDALELTNSPTWFFIVLFGVKFIADKINKYIPHIIGTVFLFVVVLHFIGIDLPRHFCVNAAVYGFLFFMIGKYIKSNLDTIYLPKIRYSIYTLSILATAYVLLNYDRFDMYLANTYNPVVYFTSSIFASISILLLCRSAFKHIPYKCYDFIKTNSRGTMLIVGTHYVLLKVLVKVLPDGIAIPFLLKLFIVTISTIPYYFVIKYTFNKFPILYGKRKQVDGCASCKS